MVKKNPRVGNSLLMVSSFCPSPPRALVVSDSILLSHAFVPEPPFPCPAALTVHHVSGYSPSASALLSSPSLHTHTQAPCHWGTEMPWERLWPRPGKLTCPLRYAENTRAGPATLGLIPNHAASEPAKGLQLPLPLRDLRAGREGPASGG